MSVRLICAFTLLALPFGLNLAAPPTPQMCDDPDMGVRFKCKFGNILAQQEATAEMLNDMPEIPDGRKQILMTQTQRGMRSHGRSDAANFKQLAKRNSPKCQVAELMNDGKGDDDGICKGNEDCVEVLGDQIGDDIQPCKQKGNPNEREVCVEICDNEAIASDPDNFDEMGQGMDVDEQLDEVTDQYMQLNDMLENNLTLRAAADIMAANGDPCASVITARTSTEVMAFALGAKIGAEISADIADKFCNTDAGGFNAAAVCSIPEGIKGIAVFISDTMSFIDADIDSQTIDTTLECLQQVNTSVGESNAALESIETKVDRLDQQVKQLQQQLLEVMGLLNTPQGRRPDFPGGI